MFTYCLTPDGSAYVACLSPEGAVIGLAGCIMLACMAAVLLFLLSD